MNSIKTTIYLILFSSLYLPFTATKVVAEIPEPECVSVSLLNEETACGYNCEKSFDGRQVACAEWPEGKCEATSSSVACGPPAPDNWQEKYESSSNSERDRDRDCDCDCDE